MLIQLQGIQFRIKYQMFTEYLVKLPDDAEMDAAFVFETKRNCLIRRLCAFFLDNDNFIVNDGALFVCTYAAESEMKKRTEEMK